MRRRARVDGNHGAIVSTLRAIGCSVASLAAVGDGVPDLLVGYHGWTGLAEVKNPEQDRCKRRLRESQLAFRSAWRGHPIAVIETSEQAVDWAIKSSLGDLGRAR